jgi:Protein of unknown function (DUF3997)
MHRSGIVIFLCLLISCSSDATKELGGSYFLRIEGESTNEILNYEPNKNGIPPAVLKYNFNDSFIIAEQKPNKFNDVMHDDSIEYPNGRKRLYYWLILKHNNKLIGPMNGVEFKAARNKYKVPKDLMLQSVYY